RRAGQPAPQLRGASGAARKPGRATEDRRRLLQRRAAAQPHRRQRCRPVEAGGCAMTAEQRLPDVSGAQPLFEPRLFPADFGNRTAEVERLARRLAETAVERDRAGGSAPKERELLRDSGLLSLAVPQQYGGQGVAWPEIYRIVRYLAAADSSLAHLFAFQHLQVATILLFGTPEQQRHWLTRTVQERWFWGNATNGRDTGLALSRREDHYELNGSKSFCSGA